MPCSTRHRTHRKRAPEGTGPLASAGSAAAGGPAPRRSLTDTALEAGHVIKAVAGGHIACALGSAGPTSPLAGDGSGDLVIGVAYPAAAAGAEADWYPTGTRAPIAGLPVGPVFRSAAGRPVAGADLAVDDWTNGVGVSDGTGLEVLITPPFQWSPP